LNISFQLPPDIAMAPLLDEPRRWFV